MELVIHAYGYSKIIFHALNGLAMFRMSSFYPVVINTMVLVMGVFYALRISASGEHWRQYLKKYIGMIIFVNSLLLPKSSMLINDHVENDVHKIDNIPLAFALPIGMLENFGHLLTIGFEQAFSKIGSKSSLMYYKYGTVFGARITKEVLEARIREPEVVSNMQHLIERCIILPAMIGHKFTKEELFKSYDIWGLVKKSAGVLTKVSLTIDGVKQNVTCKEAVGYFDKAFDTQNASIITYLNHKFKALDSDASNNNGAKALNLSIKNAIKEIYHGGHNVDAVIKNNIIINGINDWRVGKFATARAQMHQEAGGLLSGDIAEKTLVGSLAIMKVFLYTAFIFLFPLLIVSGGIGKYIQWIVASFSLALWPPLFTILNMIIDFAYDPLSIVSYSTWSTELKKVDSIASLAANLTLSIPFLAYWITKIGGDGVMHLAGSILNTAHSAVSSVAAERSSGSRSWDNDSIGNATIAHRSSYKEDHNLEYVSGESISLTSDGASIKRSSSGQEIISGGPGITSDVGETKYSLEDSRILQATEGVAMSKEKLESDTRNLSIAKSNITTKSKDWIKNIAEKEMAGELLNYESMGEDGSSVSKIVSVAKTLHKDYGYSWEQSAEAAISTDVSMPLGKIINILPSVHSAFSASNESNQSFGEKNTTEDNSSVARNLGAIERAANSHLYSKDTIIDKNLSQSVHSAYEEHKRQEAIVSSSLQEVSRWERAQSIANNSSSSSSRDMTRILIDRYMEETGVTNRAQAFDDVSTQNPSALRVWHKMQQEDSYVKDLVQDLGRNNATNDMSDGLNILEKFESKYQVDDHLLDSKDVDIVNINEMVTEHAISSRKQMLSNMHSDIYKNAYDQESGVRGGIEIISRDNQNFINNMENGRMRMVGGPDKDAFHTDDYAKRIKPTWKKYASQNTEDKEKVDLYR